MAPALPTAPDPLNATPTKHPLISSPKPLMPYTLAPFPNPPPAADWTSKSKNIHKPTSVHVTHPPSTTRNAKSKRKYMKDGLDKAAILSNPMIVDPPSISKYPSKPKPKLVSDPPNNNNDTNKEARKATEIAHNGKKQ
jgi:hypothetical protein